MDLGATSNLIAMWPHDWIFIGAFIIFIALDALRSGSARAASIALALPAAYLAFDAANNSFFVGPLLASYPSPIVHIALFAFIAGLIFFATYRSVFGASDGGRVLQAITLGVAATAAIVIVWLQIPALDYAWHFGDQVRALFAPAYRLWWLLCIFIAVAFARS